jgi:hypothetical protein
MTYRMDCVGNGQRVVNKLDAMQIFVRVAEKGSFSAVAKERGVGQPAVSKQISALESARPHSSSDSQMATHDLPQICVFQGDRECKLFAPVFNLRKGSISAAISITIDAPGAAFKTPAYDRIHSYCADRFSRAGAVRPWPARRRPGPPSATTRGPSVPGSPNPPSRTATGRRRRHSRHYEIGRWYR